MQFASMKRVDMLSESSINGHTWWQVPGIAKIKTKTNLSPSTAVVLNLGHTLESPGEVIQV